MHSFLLDSYSSFKTLLFISFLLLSVSLKFWWNCPPYGCFMLFSVSPVHTSFSIKTVNSSRSNTAPTFLLGMTWTCLEKKKKQFWKVPWIGRLALSTHCGKCFWKTWLNGKTQVMMDQRSGLQLCHSICAPSVCPSLQAGWFWWFPACAVCYSYLRAQSALLAPNWGVLGGDLQREHWPKIVTWILVAHLPHPGLRDHGWVHCFSVCPTIPL